MTLIIKSNTLIAVSPKRNSVPDLFSQIHSSSGGFSFFECIPPTNQYNLKQNDKLNNEIKTSLSVPNSKIHFSGLMQSDDKYLKTVWYDTVYLVYALEAWFITYHLELNLFTIFVYLLPCTTIHWSYICIPYVFLSHWNPYGCTSPNYKLSPPTRADAVLVLSKMTNKDASLQSMHADVMNVAFYESDTAPLATFKWL